MGTPRAEIEGSSDSHTDWHQDGSFEVGTLGAIPQAPSSHEGLMLQSDLPELIPSDFALFSQSNELPAVSPNSITFALEHQIVSPILSPSAVSNYHEKPLISNRMIEEDLRIFLTQFDGDRHLGCDNLATVLEPVTTGTESAFQAAFSKNYSNYLQIYVYLASNNLLSEFSAEELVLLIAKTNAYSMLKKLLEPVTTTIEIFMSTLLVSAAAMGEAKICRVLIEAGADMDAHSGQTMRTTPLHQAISYGQAECARMILEAGADPNLVVDGKTPLHNACSYSRCSPKFEIADLLLQHGAQVNPPQDSARLTPLQLAVRTDNPELVQLFLDKGADPNIFTTSKSGTALQIACTKSGNAVIVELLINAGADIDSCSGYQFRDREEEDSADSDTESRSSEEEDESDYFLDSSFGNSVKPPILIAAEYENWEAVQLLLEEGATVNASLKRGASKVLRKELEEFETPVSTPLQAAVRAENITMTRMLLAYGAHVDQKMKGRHGFTALQIAAIVGNERLVEILLRKGAEINAPAGVYYGRTALQAAASHLDTKLLSLLLREGADVNAPPALSQGKTALQIAAAEGNIEGVRILLDARAIVNVDPSLTEGTTTLGAALTAERHLTKSEIVDLLLRAGASTAVQINGRERYAPLHSAVRKQDLDMTRRLLEKGASPNIGFCARTDKTPLQSAASHGNDSLVQELIKHGADIHAPPYRNGGCTALQAAASNGNEATVKTLLRFGAKIRSKIADFKGVSAIEASVARGDYLLTQLLLEKEPDVISSDPVTKGRILGKALVSWKCDIPLLELLLKGGAYVGKTSHSESRSFLQMAIEGHNFRLVEYLVSAGANVNHRWKSIHECLATPLQSAVQLRNIDIVELLLHKGVDVNVPANENGGQTALQIAVSQNNRVIVKLLISHGADVNGLPSPVRGRSALQEAASRGFVELTQYLLACGADPNLPAARVGGFTALQGAAIEGKIRIVVMLIQAGAHVNAAPAVKQGRSAIEGAAENGRLDTLHILLKHHPDTEDFDIIRKRAARLALANGHLAIGRFLTAYRKYAWKA